MEEEDVEVFEALMCRRKPIDLDQCTKFFPDVDWKLVPAFLVPWYFRHVAATPQKCKEILTMAQRTKAWEDERAKRQSGSTAGYVNGSHPHKRVTSFFKERMFPATYPFMGNMCTIHGTMNEPAAVRDVKLAFESGLGLYMNIMVHNHRSNKQRWPTVTIRRANKRLYRGDRTEEGESVSLEQVRNAIERKTTFPTTLEVDLEEMNLFVSPTMPHLSYSPDGVVHWKSELEGIEEDALLEIKCGANLLPYESVYHYYYDQIQMGARMLGKKLIYYVSWCPRCFRVYRIDYNEMYCDLLFNRLNEFYFTILAPSFLWLESVPSTARQESVEQQLVDRVDPLMREFQRKRAIPMPKHEYWHLFDDIETSFDWLREARSMVRNEAELEDTTPEDLELRSRFSLVFSGAEGTSSPPPRFVPKQTFQFRITDFGISRRDVEAAKKKPPQVKAVEDDGEDGSRKEGRVAEAERDAAEGAGDDSDGW